MKVLNYVLGALSLLAMVFSPDMLHGLPVLMGYTVLTNSDVDAVWSKAQGKLVTGYNFISSEFKWLSDFKEKAIDASLRTMEYPVDFKEDRGVTSLPEGGREAEPMSVNAVDASISFIHLNARFTVAKRAKWALSKSPKAALQNQLTFQGRKKMEALMRVASDMFYGYSTNYICQTSTNATQSSGTYTLKNALGDSAFTGSTTATANYIANLIKVGDRVALIRSGALVTNSAAGEVTAVTAATPSVAITWGGSVDSDDNDYLVFSNGASATVIAHTSYNRGLVGLRDICTSTSVHFISKATHPNWDVSYSSTAAGRFNGTKWRKALDEIHNTGNEDSSVVTIMSKGVRRDVADQYSAGVRFDDSMDMEIDAEPKARGKTFKGTKRVPPGTVTMFDEKRAVYKRVIHEQTDAPGWGMGKELIDDSGWLFPVEWSGLIGTDSRRLFAYFEGQTEQ